MIHTVDRSDFRVRPFGLTPLLWRCSLNLTSQSDCSKTACATSRSVSVLYRYIACQYSSTEPLHVQLLLHYKYICMYLCGHYLTLLFGQNFNSTATKFAAESANCVAVRRSWYVASTRIERTRPNRWQVPNNPQPVKPSKVLTHILTHPVDFGKKRKSRLWHSVILIPPLLTQIHTLQYPLLRTVQVQVQVLGGPG